MFDGMKPLVIKRSNPKTEFEVRRGKKNPKIILNGDNKSASSKGTKCQHFRPGNAVKRRKNLKIYYDLPIAPRQQLGVESCQDTARRS